MTPIMYKWKRMLVFLLAAVMMAGCSVAGETDADVQEIRGTSVSSGDREGMTADEALTKATEFLDAAAPGMFTVSLMSSDLQTVGEREVYLIELVIGEGEGAVAYEPAMAVDPLSGILYSYYPDGTLTPAAEDTIWDSLAETASLTPEEQQNLAAASTYASELEEAGTAEFVLPLKSGQYVYADANAIYIGYEGAIYQTLFHDGNEGIVIDETTLLSRDMNFDGYDDILLCASSGTANNYYYLWLCDPAENNFIAYPGFEELSSPTLSADTQQISTYERGSAIDFGQDVWRWDDTGTLVKVSEYTVASDGNGGVTITRLAAGADEPEEFHVTEEEYTTVNDLMSGSLVDFCISRYGGSESRNFTFEGVQTVADVSCYSVLMSEGGEEKVRLFIDENTTYMVMLDEDCDGEPEQTVNINE